MIIINSLAYASFCIDFELKINLFELSFDTKNLWFFSAMMLEFSEFKLADNLKITQPLLPVTVSFLTSSPAAAKAKFSWVKIGAAGCGNDASAGCCCQHILHFWRKIIRFLLRRLYVGVKAQRDKEAKLSKSSKKFWSECKWMTQISEMFLRTDR